MPEIDPLKHKTNADSENELLRGDDEESTIVLTQVQIKSLYHEPQTDKLSASVGEMSEFLRSSKTKNTSAEVSEIETGSGTKRSAEENYHYRRLSLESPDKVARRSLE